jgi:hypothetical protein
MNVHGLCHDKANPAFGTSAIKIYVTLGNFTSQVSITRLYGSHYQSILEFHSPDAHRFEGKTHMEPP